MEDFESVGAGFVRIFGVSIEAAKDKWEQRMHRGVGVSEIISPHDECGSDSRAQQETLETCDCCNIAS